MLLQRRHMIIFFGIFRLFSCESLVSSCSSSVFEVCNVVTSFLMDAVTDSSPVLKAASWLVNSSVDCKGIHLRSCTQLIEGFSLPPSTQHLASPHSSLLPPFHHSVLLVQRVWRCRRSFHVPWCTPWKFLLVFTTPKWGLCVSYWYGKCGCEYCCNEFSM